VNRLEVKGSFKVRMANGEKVWSVAIGLDDATLIGGSGQLLTVSLEDLRQMPLSSWMNPNNSIGSQIWGKTRVIRSGLKFHMNSRYRRSSGLALKQF